MVPTPISLGLGQRQNALVRIAAGMARSHLLVSDVALQRLKDINADASTFAS
jgi:hypothetical protein